MKLKQHMRRWFIGCHYPKTFHHNARQDGAEHREHSALDHSFRCFINGDHQSLLKIIEFH